MPMIATVGRNGLSFVLLGLALLFSGRAFTQQPGADSGQQSEAYPITVKAKNPLPVTGFVDDPYMTTNGSPVQLVGKTVGILKNTVTLDIRAPKASPPQSDHLTAVAAQDGTFTTTYTPKAAGRYEVVATAPDQRGHASTVFYAENPCTRARKSSRRPVPWCAICSSSWASSK